jgi:heme/copper-type cytochrome/quinol oxidase subunit 2
MNVTALQTILTNFAIAGFSGSVLATGTERLLSDLSTWLMVIALVAGIAASTYFLIRRSGADEQDQKTWTKRVQTAIVSTVAAEIVGAMLKVILGYYS